jgi:hypothetical protein
VVCTIQVHSHLTLNIIAFYRPPGEQNLDILSELLVDSDLGHPSIFVRDFNLPDIVWNGGDGVVKNSSQRHPMHQQALDLFRVSNLKQLVSEPTHVKGNTLDLVLVEKCLLDDVTVAHDVLPGISDHNMILINVGSQKFLTRPNKGSTNPKFNYKKADYLEISKLFWELRDKFSKQKNIDSSEMWNNFRDKTWESLAKHVPTLLSKPRGNPWMTRPLLRLIRKRNRVYQRCKKHPTQENFLLESQLKSDVKKAVLKAKSDFIKPIFHRNLMRDEDDDDEG